MIQSKNVFSALAQFLVILPRVLSHVFSIFSTFCTGVCIAVILSLLHGFALCCWWWRRQKIWVLFSWSPEHKWHLWPHWSKLCVIQRSRAVNSMQQTSGTCVVSFCGDGGGSDYPASGRKDGTDIWWAKGQTMADTVSCLPESPSSMLVGHLAAYLNGTFQPSFQLCSYVRTCSTIEYELNDRCHFCILPPLWSDGISMAMARVILEASYGKWQSGPQPA